MRSETSASDDAPEPTGTGSSTPPAHVLEENGELSIELELTDLAYGGDAVGRYQGRAIFVTGGLPGEIVRARLVRERSNYARGVLLDVLRASPERIAPAYPELGDSGGFQWQHLTYSAQLVWKARIVRQLLARIGHFVAAPVQPTIGMPPTSDPWHHRTVAQFAIGASGSIGFRRGASHEVLDMPECPLVHPALDAYYRQVRHWMRETWGEMAPDFAERFTLRVAADATVNGGTECAGLLAIEARPGSAFDVDGGPEAVATALLAAVPGLLGVVILGLPGGRGRIVVGQDFLYDRVLDRVFRISAGSFFQVNAAQTSVLVETAMEAAAPRGNDWALDGYSGVGLFSLFLADAVTHVHAIESQPSAVADARASAALNNITNVTVTEGVLERVLGGIVRQRERVDIALVDPPRSGCLPRALTQIRQVGPRALVYISCDPSTLARDLELFCGDGGYRLVSVQPVDMFPFTSHVECVAVCERVR